MSVRWLRATGAIARMWYRRTAEFSHGAASEFHVAIDRFVEIFRLPNISKHGLG